MATIRLMVMYESESVDVHYTDGSRLCLSACGSEFLFEKALPSTAHPLQTNERVRQRTQFAISEYKALLVDALTFRNKYATHPFLPEELITSDHHKHFPSNVTHIDWPAESSPGSNVTACPDGEVILSSVDGNGSLILSSSGEDFFVEFNCRFSQRGSEKHLTHLTDGSSLAQSHSHPASSGGSSLCPSTSETAKVGKDHGSCESRQRGPIQPNTVEQSRFTRPRKGYLFTTVVQHHSCASYPPHWHHPLSLAISLWKTQHGESGENATMMIPEESSRSGTCQSSNIDSTDGVKSILPESLPLRCPSPHTHRFRWNTGTSPFNEESFEGFETELVKVLWCQGVIYRVINGPVPIIEISPGDGSVIRSNGVMANYFTHYKAGYRLGDNMESTYYVSNLPPDIPGQKYSLPSVVMRASRILECYNQAKDSLKLAHMNCCWRKEVSVPEPLKLVQEAHVPNQGHFLAFSDGSAEIIFLDGVKVHTRWKMSSDTLTQAHRTYSEVQQPCSWCQLTLPNGQQLLVQTETPGPYYKYLSHSAEWCCWVLQLHLSPDQSHPTEPVLMHSSRTTNSRSVVAELEKIKRFNFLLENSHLVTTQRSSSVPTEDSRTTTGTTLHPVGESSISDALQKTARAIKDIETLLSCKQ